MSGSPIGMPMNEWVAVAGCGATPMQTYEFMEALTVTAPNTLSALTYPPDGGSIMLVNNGRTFMPVGTPPPFSVSGQTITWLSTIYGLAPGDEVNVAYTYLGIP